MPPQVKQSILSSDSEHKALADEQFMQLALREAEKGVGYVSPNPQVGAVAVKNGRVLATAYHAAYGDAHAEVALLAKLKPEEARGATIYVNLEPCCHWGKTAPCTEALIQAGVARVVIGCEDANPLVKGGGISALKQAGIAVAVGVCGADCRELNLPFLTHIALHRPWICLKVAQSLDGRIALSSGESRWISSEAARLKVHQLRARLDAVMIGSQTVIDDDPELTVRHVAGRNPVRIILDSRLRSPLSSKIFRLPQPERTWLVTTDLQPHDIVQAYEALGATVLQVPANSEQRIDLSKALEIFAGYGITGILVEGGGTVHASLLQQGLFDRFIVCTSPKIIGGDGRAAVGELGLTSLADAPALTLINQSIVGGDLWLQFDKNVHGNH